MVELEPDEPATEFPLDPVNSSQSLAEAFASPQFEQTDSTSIELGWSAYLEGNYATALQYAREHIVERLHNFPRDRHSILIQLRWNQSVQTEERQMLPPGFGLN